MSLILQLDAAGSPAKWISHEKAAVYYAKGLVSWDLGDTVEFILRGGTNARTGLRSALAVKPIIAVAGKGNIVKDYRPLPASRELVFRRDRNLCVYCGDVFHERDLTVDHIQPESRGGQYTFMNLAASCRSCNHRKGARTPEESGMPLLYLPYEPNRHEGFILGNRRIIQDQMFFLMEGVPKHSRLLM
jgi:hypothetical protein